LRKNVGALVVDKVHFLDTELADFLFAEILALATARSAGTATWTSGSAFAATSATTAGATFAARTGVGVPALTTRGRAAFRAGRRCGRISTFAGGWRRSGGCGLHWFLFL
jgi:hypothetical protein